MVAMELVVLRQSFAKHYGGEEVLERGRGCAREGCLAALPPPLFIGEGEREAAAMGKP